MGCGVTVDASCVMQIAILHTILLTISIERRSGLRRRVVASQSMYECILIGAIS